MPTMTPREAVTGLHGLLLGSLFLLAFTGTFIALWGLRVEWATPAGRAAGGRHLVLGAVAMAVLSWATVLVGTFAVYPWYRAPAPAGVHAGQSPSYPKVELLSSPRTAKWHTFGMEWKEHVGWLAPFFATAVAAVAVRYRGAIARHSAIRRVMLVLLSAAFFCAAAAGMLGALIDKVAPVQ